MCGIVGVIGSGDVAGRVLEGLRRLEYRGYDSAGIATVVNGSLDRRRAKGKIGELAARLNESALPGALRPGKVLHQVPIVDNLGCQLVSLLGKGHVIA